MQKIFFLSCFLIISSCDLPNEANTDCNGIQGGLAEIDDCGRCSGGNTDIIPNQDKDCNGECFGDSYLDNCEVCDDIAINDGITCTECDDSIIELSDEIGSLCDCDGNIIDSCGECGGEGYIDCLCESYITSNTDFNCETNGNFPYNIGDQLGCETLETSFDICYPEDCGTIKLADFEDKIIFIIYEQDWWVSCYNSIPQLEEDIILHYLDDPNVAIINILSDEPGGLSCEVWGVEGDDRVPIIINDFNYDGIFGDWFGIGSWSSPWYFIIDENFVYQAKTQNESEAENLLEDMLTNLE